jgi:Transcriptional regulator, AbiEi antitoxin
MIAAMNDVGREASGYGTELGQPPSRRDAELARLAAEQHGVVALRQLPELGLSSSAVRSRVASGRLHRVHRGVYAVGHRVLGVEGRWIAAVLACGRDAVLSHRSAAALWSLRPTTRTAIDVTVPRRVGLSRPGIDVHRATGLEPGDLTRVRGVPCTTVARTLVDLAEVIDRRELARACEQAEVLRRFDARALEGALARTTGRHGARHCGTSSPSTPAIRIPEASWRGASWRPAPRPASPVRESTPGSIWTVVASRRIFYGRRSG